MDARRRVMDSASRDSSGRAAFTLVELLVVIAIIALLLGLLIPAATEAREAARRMQYRNNIRNLGLGVLRREHAYGKFPAGVYAAKQLPPDRRDRCWAVMAIVFGAATA